MKIQTFDAEGKPNGYVVPIWNANETLYRPDQIYLTAVAPHSQKGPHLHKSRQGVFCCIKGNVRIVTRCDGPIYLESQIGEFHDYAITQIPPGVPACIYNDGDEEALVLNMPSPAWTAEDPDEWPVEDWNP